MEVFSLENQVFTSFIFYSAILALKLVAMGPLTGMQRHKKLAFSNPEDSNPHGKKPTLNDPDVERVRRAHLNDLENIPIFWILGFLYVFINPPVATAIWCFRLFTVARVLHTIVYLTAFPQPSRGICFMFSIAINTFLAVQLIMKFDDQNCFLLLEKMSVQAKLVRERMVIMRGQLEICKNLFEDPVYLGSCDHVFCRYAFRNSVMNFQVRNLFISLFNFRACISKRNNCPECQSLFYPKELHYAHEIAETLNLCKQLQKKIIFNKEKSDEIHISSDENENSPELQSKSSNKNENLNYVESIPGTSSNEKHGVNSSNHKPSSDSSATCFDPIVKKTGSKTGTNIENIENIETDVSSGKKLARNRNSNSGKKNLVSNSISCPKTDWQGQSKQNEKSEIKNNRKSAKSTGNSSEKQSKSSTSILLSPKLNTDHDQSPLAMNLTKKNKKGETPLHAAVVKRHAWAKGGFITNTGSGTEFLAV
ncbi:Microsomal glutathione S-transferase 1 [Nymphon striatum]|nr:Microsomal glutathione S-transferase 1 [Nymphon striatum]